MNGSLEVSEISLYLYPKELLSTDLELRVDDGKRTETDERVNFVSSLLRNRVVSSCSLCRELKLYLILSNFSYGSTTCLSTIYCYLGENHATVV